MLLHELLNFAKVLLHVSHLHTALHNLRLLILLLVTAALVLILVVVLEQESAPSCLIDLVS